MKILTAFMIALLTIFFAACAGETVKEAPDGKQVAEQKATAPAERNDEAAENKLATPKQSIEYQFELIKKGDFETLNNCCFTDKAKAGLTKEIVDQAQKDSSKYTIEKLFEKAEEGESDGQKTAKVIMEGGRTLTTLVETDGKWLADTIWFK